MSVQPHIETKIATARRRALPTQPLQPGPRNPPNNKVQKVTGRGLCLTALRNSKFYLVPILATENEITPHLALLVFSVGVP
jgi:hypothetical protein